MLLRSLMCESLKRSTQVVNEVPVDKKFKERVEVRTFCNCREQGYHIRISGKSGSIDCLNLWFSENRNSDQMVLYECHGYVDGLTEEAWKDADYYNSVEEIVMEITKRIETYLEEN